MRVVYPIGGAAAGEAWDLSSVDMTDQGSATISGTTQDVTDDDSNTVTLTIAQAANASTFSLSASGLTITTDGAQTSNAANQNGPVVGLEYDDYPDGGGDVPRVAAIEISSVTHGGSAGLVWLGLWDETTSSPARGRCNVNNANQGLMQQTQGGAAYTSSAVALGAAPAGLAVAMRPDSLGVFVYAFATTTAGEARGLTPSHADDLIAGNAPAGTDWELVGAAIAQSQYRVGTDSILLDNQSLTSFGVGSSGGSSTVVVTDLVWGSKA